MKKFLILFILLLLIVGSIFLVTWYLSNTETKGDNNTNNDTSNVKTKSKFEQFESALTEKGLTFEKITKSAPMVGAKEGYGYIFDEDSSVELYLFETSSDAYKNVKSSGNITIESMGITMPVDINNGIVIYYNGDVSNKTEIVNIFKSLK